MIFRYFFYGESCLDVIKSVLDEKGNIRNFPGFAPDDSWKEKQRIGICKDVRHEAQFYAMPNEEYLMLWLVQPSGWAWVDSDGFDFSGDASIMLYSVLDKSGAFKKPFALFSINHNRVCCEFDAYVDQ